MPMMASSGSQRPPHRPGRNAASLWPDIQAGDWWFEARNPAAAQRTMTRITPQSPKPTDSAVMPPSSAARTQKNSMAIAEKGPRHPIFMARFLVRRISITMSLALPLMPFTSRMWSSLSISVSGNEFHHASFAGPMSMVAMARCLSPLAGSATVKVLSRRSMNRGYSGCVQSHTKSTCVARSIRRASTTFKTGKTATSVQVTGFGPVVPLEAAVRFCSLSPRFSISASTLSSICGNQYRTTAGSSMRHT
mmetsp:Transcript_18187/g.48026  ORF Transcript_18187/g.48026 Transcript_18187/m.48026 type:complete len:249 (-) Transcript_18187:394-1140(-)